MGNHLIEVVNSQNIGIDNMRISGGGIKIENSKYATISNLVITAGEPLCKIPFTVDSKSYMLEISQSALEELKNLSSIDLNSQDVEKLTIYQKIKEKLIVDFPMQLITSLVQEVIRKIANF
jgi:hypothetical protein